MNLTEHWLWTIGIAQFFLLKIQTLILENDFKSTYNIWYKYVKEIWQHKISLSYLKNLLELFEILLSSWNILNKMSKPSQISQSSAILDYWLLWTVQEIYSPTSLWAQHYTSVTISNNGQHYKHLPIVSLCGHLEAVLYG